ncbi:MAG: S41 family peptidase [Aestuariibaculum sp.]
MMQRVLGLLFFLMLITSCNGVKKYNAQISSLHPVEDLQDDVDNVYKQLKKHHPHLYQYTSRETLDFKFDSLKKSIQTPLTSQAFHQVLAPVVTHVKQGHVSVGSANKRFTKKEKKQLKKKKFEFYDLEFQYLDDKLWVKRTKGEDSSLVGAEIVKIENETATNLVKRLQSRFSSDGYNTTLYNRYVGKVFSKLYYKENGFVDSLNVTFKHNDSIFNRTLRRIEKDKKEKDADSLLKTEIKKIEPKKLTKDERAKNKKTKKEKRKYDKTHGFISKKEGYTRNFEFIGKDSAVAYMKIKAFDNDVYKAFYEESFTKINSARTKNLILDLRDNGGGRIAEVAYLYSFLTQNNYIFIEPSEVNSRIPFLKFLMGNSMPGVAKVFTGVFSPIIVLHNTLKIKKQDGKLYYRFRFSKEKEPHPLHYKGNLYVLINGNSFSASSLLSTHLKATDRAVFVGEETGGAYNGCVAGIYKIYKTPHTKLNIRMGLMQIEAPYKQSPDGHGIYPDIEVLPTLNDMLSNSDAELNSVLKHIEEKE